MSLLKIGDAAPGFTSINQNGETVSWDSFRGKKVVLYFYPKDNTPGCTVEAKNMRDGKEELLSRGFEIVGVSPDRVKSHENFCNKYDLNFTLLSDPDKTIANAYGVSGEKQFMGTTVNGIRRTTFVIASKAGIERVFDKFDNKNHGQQILKS